MKTELSEANLKSIGQGRSVRSKPIRSYAELQKQLRYDLRTQNPEWINSDGNSPTCDCYERRLAELIWRVYGGTPV